MTGDLTAMMAQMRLAAGQCLTLMLGQASLSVAWAPDCVGMGQSVFFSVIFVMESRTVGMDQMKRDAVSFILKHCIFEVHLQICLFIKY